MPSIDRADDDLKLLFQHLSAVVDTNKVMLVGAWCRDILHRRYSAVPPQRKTDSAGVWGVSIIGILAQQDRLPRVSRDEPERSSECAGVVAYSPRKRGFHVGVDKRNLLPKLFL